MRHNGFMSQQLQSFIAKWRGRTASERGNLQTFLNEFCALGLPMPEPKAVRRVGATQIEWN